MKSVITVKDLTKDYGMGRGLFDASFQVNEGEIVGFLGPNGAGKTTAMDLIMGLTNPTSGSAEVFGQDVKKDSDFPASLSQIGYLPTEVAYYKHMKVRELFKLKFRVLGRDYSEDLNKISKIVDLDLNAKIGTLSMGNNKKVGLVNSIVHHPKLLILDEPTNGLDPVIRHEVLNLFEQRRKDGATIFLSSHSLDEVEEICDRIIMVNQGKIVLDKPTKEVLEQAFVRFRIMNTDLDKIPGLEKMEQVQFYDQTDNEVVVHVTDRKPVLEYLMKQAVYDFYIERPRLEEMFMSLYKNGNSNE